jgi:hypothetical protein
MNNNESQNLRVKYVLILLAYPVHPRVGQVLDITQQNPKLLQSLPQIFVTKNEEAEKSWRALGNGLPI